MPENDALQGPPDVPEYLDIWSIYNQRAGWERVITRGGNEDVARQALSELPEVSALSALEANRALVDLLTNRRWYVMQEAREAGATWDAIADALRITGQQARDDYRRQIEKQEHFVGGFHEARRARAVLENEE